MSTAYKIAEKEAVYYLSFQVVAWVDIFTRKIYRDIVIDSFENNLNDGNSQIGYKRLRQKPKPNGELSVNIKYNSMNYKKYIIGYFPLYAFILYILYIFFIWTPEKKKILEHIHESVFNGKVIEKNIGRDAITIKLNNDSSFIILDPYISEMNANLSKILEVGDSVTKPANMDSIYIFKDSVINKYGY